VEHPTLVARPLDEQIYEAYLNADGSVSFSRRLQPGESTTGGRILRSVGPPGTSDGTGREVEWPSELTALSKGTLVREPGYGTFGYPSSTGAHLRWHPRDG